MRRPRSERRRKLANHDSSNLSKNCLIGFHVTPRPKPLDGVLNWGLFLTVLREQFGRVEDEIPVVSTFPAVHVRGFVTLLLLVAMSRPLVAQSSHVVGNCLVIHIGEVRDIPDYLRDACAAQAKQYPRVQGFRVQDVYMWLPPFLTKAFWDADTAVCLAIACPNRIRGANVVLYFGFPVNALESAQGAEDFVTIALNSALIDVTETSMAALMRDAVADHNGTVADDGYRELLSRFRAQGGKPCSTPFKYPKLNGDSSADFPVNRHIAPQLVYVIILAHELSHAHTVDASCFHRGGPGLGREMACDSLAFLALAKKGELLPPLPIALAIAMGQSEVLYGPLYFPTVADSTLPDLLSIRDWDERGQAWLRGWRQECSVDAHLRMCAPGWPAAAASSADLLALKKPKACTGGWSGLDVAPSVLLPARN